MLRPLLKCAMLAPVIAVIVAAAGVSPAVAVTGVSIVGYVVDASGPVLNANVNAQAVKGDANQLSVATASTDAAGRFELDGVKPGSYFISADKINYDPSTTGTLITYLGDTPYRSI